jgi:thioredoxin 1
MVKWWERKEYKSKLKKLIEESEKLKEERLKKERKALKERPEPSRGKGKSVSDKPVDLTDATFTEAVQNYPLVVVDCWAPWCAPCHMVTPVVEELARDYAGKILFGKLNVDENRRIAMQHQIMSIPTMLVFKSGKLIDRMIGAMPRQMLEPKITRYL